MTVYQGVLRGLAVSQDGAGWRVSHAESHLPATPSLRQRRFAEQARDELLATGVDFTRDKGAVSADRAQWAEVYVRWQTRARQESFDDLTGEYYSAHVGYGTFVPSAAWAQAYRDALKAKDGERLGELVKSGKL